MIYEPLIAYIAAQVSELKPTENLFINQIPIDVEPAVMLRDSMSGTSIDGDTNLRRGTFSVVSRGRNYSAAKALLQKASDALTIKGEKDFAGFQIKMMRPINEPFSYAVTPGNLMEFSVSFVAIYAIVP